MRGLWPFGDYIVQIVYGNWVRPSCSSTLPATPNLLPLMYVFPVCLQHARKQLVKSKNRLKAHVSLDKNANAEYEKGRSQRCLRGKERQAKGGESGGGNLEQGVEPGLKQQIESMGDVGEFHHQRALIEVFGVGEDDGVYVLICGLVLAGATFIACCYCKVYDPLKLWCIKKIEACNKKKPTPAAEPEKEIAGTPEVRHTCTLFSAEGVCVPDLEAEIRWALSAPAVYSSRCFVRGIWPV